MRICKDQNKKSDLRRRFICNSKRKDRTVITTLYFNMRQQ